MFGLTRREQRWKAEQQATEMLVALVGTALRSVADVRVAEARTDAQELARLRAKNDQLRRLLLTAHRTETPVIDQPQ